MLEFILLLRRFTATIKKDIDSALLLGKAFRQFKLKSFKKSTKCMMTAIALLALEVKTLKTLTITDSTL